MIMSIVIAEHNEGKEFVNKMIEQTSSLEMIHETIFATSMTEEGFRVAYGPFAEDIVVLGNVMSTGAAINAGALAAKSRSILFVDCHVCFTEQDLVYLLNSLDTHPSAVISPGIYPVNFPDCTAIGSVGYGAAFHFDKTPFEWRWLTPVTLQEPYTVPFIAGCALIMRRSTFDRLNEFGGFLSDLTGILWDEEASMRLWRLGHPSYIDPRAQFGHLFVGSESRPDTSTRDYNDSTLVKVVGAYVNVFDRQLWNHIEKLCIDSWGNEIWYHDLAIAQSNYVWLRRQMWQFKNVINEEWFFRK